MNRIDEKKKNKNKSISHMLVSNFIPYIKCMIWYIDLNKSFLCNLLFNFSLNTNDNERKKW
jgi:hypothetical protein